MINNQHPIKEGYVDEWEQEKYIKSINKHIPEARQTATRLSRDLKLVTSREKNLAWNQYFHSEMKKLTKHLRRLS